MLPTPVDPLCVILGTVTPAKVGLNAVSSEKLTPVRSIPLLAL